MDLEIATKDRDVFDLLEEVGFAHRVQEQKMGNNGI
jgi:hypothetical protein